MWSEQQLLIALRSHLLAVPVNEGRDGIAQPELLGSKLVHRHSASFNQLLDHLLDEQRGLGAGDVAVLDVAVYPVHQSRHRPVAFGPQKPELLAKAISTSSYIPLISMLVLR